MKALIDFTIALAIVAGLIMIAFCAGGALAGALVAIGTPIAGKTLTLTIASVATIGMVAAVQRD